MSSRVWKIDRWNPEPQLIAEAARVLRSGGLVAFPTETVYGLGANGLDSKAVREIFRAKGRPADNPLILHLSDIEKAFELADVDDRAKSVMEFFWPGPLTLVLPALPIVPKAVTAGLETVALRMPDHPVAAALLAETGLPVAAPSANRSGRPSPTDAKAVACDLGKEVDLILDAGEVQVGLESTVLDLSGTEPLLLRPGGLPVELLEEFLQNKLGVPDEKSKKRSPGTRYRHYAPTVPVVVWDGMNALSDSFSKSFFRDAAFMGLDFSENEIMGLGFKKYIIFNSLENYAQGLFAGFRDLEMAEITKIVVQWPDSQGIGLALRDRIQRAATEK